VEGDHGVVIRRPTLEDADGIAAVQNDGWRTAYGHLLPERFYDASALADREAIWTRVLTGPDVPTRLRVAEDAGRLIAFAVATPSEELDRARDLQLNAIFVNPDYHGTDVAGRLLDAVLGAEPAQLWVARDNPRAHAFYAKHGFRVDGLEKLDADLDDLIEVRFVR
jgi:GNAT superfamily N-acetyltransferase